MSRRTLRIFVLLSLVSILGIVCIQYAWFKKAYDTREDEFNRNVNLALKEVVKGILRYNNTPTIPPDPVQQLSPNYFAVMVNDRIHADVLEHYLQSELKKFNVAHGFEYSIYDCENRRLVFGGYVEGAEQELIPAQRNLPAFKGDNYYFTIYFPHKVSGIIGSMQVWLYSSLVLLVVVVFFSYSLFVILRQKRLSEVQRDFINNMTHEFKTPVSTIAISAETLKEPGIVNEPQRLLTYATIIGAEADRLKGQVERVLSLAQTETRLKLNLEETDLHSLLKEAAHSMLRNVTHKKVTLDLNLAVNRHVLAADKLHLGNLVSNIVDNSIKYSGDEVTISISSRNQSNMLDILFSDNGIGISKDQQKKIFDKFYRVPTGNLHNVKGFGIGLSYVRLIAASHRGSIKVIAHEGPGSTFRLSLPLL